jgi:hypothetical protein
LQVNNVINIRARNRGISSIFPDIRRTLGAPLNGSDDQLGFGIVSRNLRVSGSYLIR